MALKKIKSYHDLLYDDQEELLITTSRMAAELHAENVYAAVKRFALASSGVYTMLVTTPATGTVHSTFELNVDDVCEVELRQSATFSAGVTITPYNLVMDSSEVSTVTHKGSGTIATSGTFIDGAIIGTSSKKITTGGADGSFERHLKAGTIYEIKITADNADTRGYVKHIYFLEDD